MWMRLHRRHIERPPHSDRHWCVTIVCRPASNSSFVIWDCNFSKFDIADWFCEVIWRCGASTKSRLQA